MRDINLVRFISSTVLCAVCSLVGIFLTGCDFGTYGERVQSTGGSLPVTPVSQDGGSDSKDASAGSDAKAAGSDSKDAGSDSKDAGSDAKEAMAGSDSKAAPDKQDERRSRAEAEARARAAGPEDR